MRPHNNTGLRVGLTGGIGSGKSTVGRLFLHMGRTVILADEIARELTDQDKEIRFQIRRAFGEESYPGNGPLNRKWLANIVFRDIQLKKKLDGIVHPKVFIRIEERINSLPEVARWPYVVIEAALIYETGMHKRLDYIVVIDAPAEARISRVVERDHCSEQEVRDRINSQMEVQKKLAKADFIILNDSEETNLVESVKFIDRLLTHRAGSAPK